MRHPNRNKDQSEFGFRSMGEVDDLGIVHARRTIIRPCGTVEVTDLDWRRTTEEEDAAWEAEVERIAIARETSETRAEIEGERDGDDEWDDVPRLAAEGGGK